MIISEQQIQAIKHKDGPALVLSIPGSGKTTVLLNRIIYLNNTHSIEFNQILNLTFSKIQAEDMKSRFFNLYNSKANFYTIHAFAYNIIKIFSKKSKINYKLIEGNKNFNKYDVIKRLFWELFNSRSTNEDLDNFFTNYTLIKNNMIDLQELPIDNSFAKIAMNYEKFKKDNYYIDFDDMLSISYNILKTNHDILKIIKKMYKYIQLDEGQDASLIQFKLLELIVYPENNIFILADDDQSIYSFRGANPNYLLNIDSILGNIKFYYLSTNYRSIKDIVMLSDYIIKNNIDRYLKNVESHSDIKSPIQIIKVKNVEFQNKFILNIINNLSENETIAILFRNNISAYAVSFFLLSENIVFNKRLNFSTNNINLIINDLISLFEFSLDSSNLKIFKSIYYKLNLYLNKDYVNNLIIYNNENILDILLNDSTIKNYQKELISILKESLLKIKYLNLTNSLKLIFDDLNYIEYISKRYENMPIGYIQEILIYLSSDLNSIYDLKNSIDMLEALLKNKLSNSSNIYISTIHQSKGLEYDNIILIDLVDGEFPIYSTDKINIEEERRLFYVAITRAKKQLFLVSPKYRYNTKIKNSSFINEIKSIKK